MTASSGPVSAAAFEIDAAGWLTHTRRVPSPNCDARPVGEAIELLVVHSISLPPGEFGSDGIERLFTNQLDPNDHPYYATVAGLRVSAHCLIQRDGALTQFVPFAARAWHAGASRWRERERCNDFSIGVELEGTDTGAFEANQYATLIGLARALRAHYPIAAIAAHSEIAPGRKTDPGPAFDWARLHRLLAPRAR